MENVVQIAADNLGRLVHLPPELPHRLPQETGRSRLNHRLADAIRRRPCPAHACRGMEEDAQIVSTLPPQRVVATAGYLQDLKEQLGITREKMASTRITVRTTRRTACTRSMTMTTAFTAKLAARDEERTASSGTA